jgi:transcriptional regulator with XRE-family HTH domain
MDIRKENKLTRKALSELSGFKEITIASYEKNIRKPSKEYIKFISLYFDVSLDYINGVSDENKPLDNIYRVFEMYKEIYPQNASKVDEVFEKYGISDLVNDILDLELSIFYKLIKELNISRSSFDDMALFIEGMKDSHDKFKMFGTAFGKRDNKLDEDEKDDEILDDGIVISKEFYLSVIKKRNEPNIYIPLENKTVDYTINLEIEKNLKDMNLKIISLNKEIEKNLKDMNTKINNFNQEIDKTLKDIQKIQEDLTLKKP